MTTTMIRSSINEWRTTKSCMDRSFPKQIEWAIHCHCRYGSKPLCLVFLSIKKERAIWASWVSKYPTQKSWRIMFSLWMSQRIDSTLLCSVIIAKVQRNNWESSLASQPWLRWMTQACHLSIGKFLVRRRRVSSHPSLQRWKRFQRSSVRHKLALWMCVIRAFLWLRTCSTMN